MVNGHNSGALTDALRRPLQSGKPSVVIANTRKGKGVSFMEDVGKWHHGVPSDSEYERALGEIDGVIARLEGTKEPVNSSP